MALPAKAVFVSLVTLVAVPGTRGGEVCTLAVSGEVWLNRPWAARVLGRVLADSIDSGGLLPPDAVDRRSAGHQVVVTGRTKGSGPQAVGDTVNVFLWSLRPNCAWAPAGARLDPGAEYHFTMALRPDSLWVGGRPTYDVDPSIGFRVFPDGVGHRRDHLPQYLEFLNLVPDETEWEQDCRVGVEALERWTAARPELAGNLPFSSVPRTLRMTCNAHIARYMQRLRRHPLPEELVPETLARFADQQGCSFGDEGRVRIVRGNFTDSNSEEHAGLCTGVNHWRLVVAPSDGSVTELASGRGDPELYWIAALPREYFDWADAWDTRFRFGSRPLPTLEKILLIRAARSDWVYQFEDGLWSYVRETLW